MPDKNVKPETFMTDLAKGHYELTPKKITQATNNAKNKGTNPASLKLLASHPLEKVRVALASNPAIPISVMTILTRDFSWRVRLALSENQALPFSCITQMLQEERVKLIANKLLTRLETLVA